MKKNRKGFTLAELLIVVAIIAVLVAIAIPVFTTQLEKSREATDIANVRSAYATVVAAYLVDGEIPDSITVNAKQTVGGWQTENGGQIEYMNGETSATYSYDAVMAGSAYTVGIEVDENGNVTPAIE